MILGSESDPAVRRERARLGGQSRTSTDYYLAKVVERADELSDEQVEVLRIVLAPTPPAGEGTPEAART